MRFGNWLLTAGSVFVVLSAGQSAAAAISQANLIKAIREAKIWSPEYKVQAVISGEEADISTYRNPKATDKDCKIDAVLVARASMNADPATIKRVKVTFYDATNTSKYRQVVVREGDVKAFASREMTPDELLDSIDISTGEVPSTAAALKNKSYQDISQSPGVVDGPFKGERMELLGRIDALKERGVGVQPFVAQFLRLEDKVRNGDRDGIMEGVDFLSTKLKEQEQAYNDAHKESSLKDAYAGYNHPAAASGSPSANQGQPAGPGGMAELMHQQLGDLAPAPGPMPMRRFRVARRIRALQDQGQVVDSYVRLYREIEELAAQNDRPRLEMQLQTAERELGLQSFRGQ